MFRKFVSLGQNIVTRQIHCQLSIFLEFRMQPLLSDFLQFPHFKHMLQLNLIIINYHQNNFSRTHKPCWQDGSWSQRTSSASLVYNLVDWRIWNTWGRRRGHHHDSDNRCRWCILAGGQEDCLSAPQDSPDLPTTHPSLYSDSPCPPSLSRHW